MKKILLLSFLSFVSLSFAWSQKVILDGYIFEKNNRGFLREAKITVLEAPSERYVGETLSDAEGHFTLEVATEKKYYVDVKKNIFYSKRLEASTEGKKEGEKVFVKAEMQRQPGYLFEVTLAEKRYSQEIPVDAVNGSRIEVFNNTANKMMLAIDSAKSPVFSINFEKGNHYTLLIRKEGFYNKRMEAHVEIDGCILCFEGVGTVRPGIVDNLTTAEGLGVGTLLANVELERIDTNRNIVYENIYYDLGSADLRKEAMQELDKAATLLKNNPMLVAELGSHTDARGSSESNQRLSQARAESAVNYIIYNKKIASDRLKAKGYGEERTVNGCVDGVICDEREHQRNRRTELKIIGFTKNPYQGRTLEEIVHAEQLEKFLESDASEQVYVAPAAATGEVPKSYDVAEKPQISIQRTDEEDVKEVKKEEKKEEVKPEIKEIKEVIEVKKEIKKETKKETKKGTKKETKKPIAAVPIVEEKPKEIKEVVKETPKEIVKEIPKEVVKEASREVVEVPIIATKETPKNALLAYTLEEVDKEYIGYKIELFTSPNLLEKGDKQLDIASNLGNDIRYFKSDGIYEYYVGELQTWYEAQSLLKKALPTFPKAIVVDFFKGTRLK